MKDEPFTEIIHKKAKSLRITPRLLLIAIGALGKNEELTENELFQRYGKEIILEMEEAVHRQKNSSNEKAKEAAKIALSEISPNLLPIINAAFNNINSLRFYLSENERILNFHKVAWNFLINEQNRIRKKYSRKTGYFDIAQIIKTLCPTEIEQCRILATVIKDQDTGHK